VLFKPESLGEIQLEIDELSLKHYAEIAPDKSFPLALQLDRYAILEKAGMLKIYSARLEDGKLAGYQSFLLSISMHYGYFQAHQDTLYIDPVYRGHGLSFLSYCDDELKKIGVQIVRQSVTPKRDFSPVLKRLGYTLEEVQYTRRLS